ncbi:MULTISPECIES: DUF928 domain-containing protein [unclassified Coleofasciculus]|uniref:DUF928 domain-containing protein n=1 Tax=unclassified Coleofasciculus TaxID=2692782 RepID=UPI00187E1B37|nr:MULTISPECIES: DUF928 domain-containing protein [unclassified Coleofasciculus]MBE9128237.1 DUF928 domain-containing protein [Coleofasciculus sp. LEGE 07081]MBE9147768.1 DUF928 domain-containing protein [Coleofasciculus sp. LEGE 07092]
MAWFTRSSRLTILTVALTLGLAVYLPKQVQAQFRTASLSSQIPDQWQFTPPKNPDSAPVSVNREGGATRGPECIRTNESLVALVPESGMNKTPGIGKTMAAYPTVFWYMPQTSASTMEFVLQDADARDIYRVEYSLDQSGNDMGGTPRIMSLTLPSFSNLPPLETNKDYYWQLALVCDPLDRSADVVVGGGIQRTSRDLVLESRLRQATPQEQMALYAKEGMWYDTLKTLVRLRQNSPQDPELAQAWDKLLNSVKLEVISKQPGLEDVIGEQPRIDETSGLVNSN